jgi:hypothetical protein
MPVMPDEPDRAVHGIRPGTREIHLIDIARRPFGQRRGKPGRRLGSRIEAARRIRQAADLVGGGLHHALMPSTRVDAPQPRESLLTLAACGIRHLGPMRRTRHPYPARFLPPERRDGMRQTAAVKFDKHW